MDAEGWVDINQLLEVVKVSRVQLENMVTSCDKQRNTICGDKIRANQGHSVLVNTVVEDLETKFSIHATTVEASKLITRSGISPMTRLHVHSLDIDSKDKFMLRKLPIHIIVDLDKMRRMKHKVFRSSNGVTLTCCVPPSCIDRIYRNEVEKFNRCEVEFQIFGLGNMIDKFSNMAESVTGTSDRTTKLIEGMTDCFTSIKDKFSSGFMEGFGDKLAGIIFQLFMSNPRDRVKTLAMAIVSACGFSALKYVVQIANKYMFGNEHEFQSIDYDENVILASLLGLALQIFIGLPKDFKMSTILDFFASRGRSMKFALEGFASLQKFMKVVLVYVKEHVFGIYDERSPLDGIFSDYDIWVKAVKTVIFGHSVPLSTRLETDEKLWFEIDSLYSKAMEYARDIGMKRLPAEFNTEFQKIFKVIEDAKKQCDASGVFGNKPRVEPLVIHLFGESGVGKSGMAWPLCTDLNQVFCSSIAEAKDFAKNIYFRNTEQEFWDGYAGQNVVCYDDFGQRVDGTSNPNEEFMELIRASNMAPYPLHMADLVDKRRTKFISKAIVLTSNRLEQQVNSLTFPDAYRRRVDLCAEVTVHDEYTKPGFSSYKGENVQRLDPTKCDGPVDTDCYILTLYDAESQTPITNKDGKPVECTYNEFIQLCLKQLKVKINRGINLNKALENRITEQRFNELNKHVFQMNFSDMKNIISEKYTDAHLYIDNFEFTSIWRFADKIKEEYAQRLMWYNTIAAFLTGSCILWYAFMKKKTTVKCERHNIPQKSCVSCIELTNSGDAQTAKKQHKTELANSGDSLTGKKQHHVELTQSGDAMTVKRSHITELANSGDAMTQKKRFVVEIANSGDLVTQKRQHLVEHALDSDCTKIASDMQAWEDSVAQDLISTRILSNLYKIIRVRDGQELPLLNGLFIRDTIMLLPKHIHHMLSADDDIKIENIYGSIHVLPLSKIIEQVISGRDNTYKDAMLWQFPRNVNAHSDLVKHFQSMPELSHGNIRMCLPTLRSSNGTNILYIHGNTTAEVDNIVLDTAQGEFHIRDCLRYELNTTSGDCGAPIICNDTRVVRKICGIHIAGETSGRSAFAQSVTKQDLESHLVLMRAIITDPDQIANVSVKHANHQSIQFDVEYSQDKIRSILGVAADTFFYIGKCIRPIFTPSKTEIRKSIIHGLVSDPLTKPAILFDKEVNILKKNLAKCGENTPFIEEKEIEIAVNSYKQKIFPNKKENLCRILTNEEAISGSNDSEFMNGISRQSSPGYPYVFNKDSGKPGKTTWFGTEGNYEISEELIQRISHLESIAAEGKRIPFIWTDTLKDERRPIAKVDALKTRVFAAGPMDYTILVRKYFLGFIANTMENRIHNEQSLGTNPFGKDWEVTARVLSKYGKKVFAGDFSTFDGTLNPLIMFSFVKAVNEWYDDGAKNALIRETLFLDVMNSVHLCGDQFYGTTHSQPSGNPLTTILNSWYNSVSMRIAYGRAAMMAKIKPPRFNDVISMVSYGDDNVINFSDKVDTWFNQITVSEAYTTFGMTYTDEAKTGNIQAFKTLQEVAYLKRGFRFADGYVYAPLDLDTCLEMCNWIRDSPDPQAQCAANIDNAARELSQHGESTFSEWVPKLVAAFYQRTNRMPNVGTYSQYVEEIE